jgi:hypothetical protein
MKITNRRTEQNRKLIQILHTQSIHNNKYKYNSMFMTIKHSNVNTLIL